MEGGGDRGRWHITWWVSHALNVRKISIGIIVFCVHLVLIGPVISNSYLYNVHPQYTRQIITFFFNFSLSIPPPLSLIKYPCLSLLFSLSLLSTYLSSLLISIYLSITAKKIFFRYYLSSAGCLYLCIYVCIYVC